MDKSERFKKETEQVVEAEFELAWKKPEKVAKAEPKAEPKAKKK